MAESHIVKNLADKRKEIQAYIGGLERDLEQARRDLSAIIATERVFQSSGPKVTAYTELAALFLAQSWSCGFEGFSVRAKLSGSYRSIEAYA